MKSQSYVLFAFLFQVTFTGCNQKENNTTQPRVNIHLPAKSANVVFHIKENKVSSFEILNEDGSGISEQLVYRQISAAGEEKCYRCPSGETDTKNCKEIPCPIDPCKEIYCGPLDFEMYVEGSSTVPERVIRFSIVPGANKK